MFNLSKIFNKKVDVSKQDKDVLDALLVKKEWSAIFIDKGKSQTKKKIFIPNSANFKQSLRILLIDFQKRTNCHESVYSYLKGKSFTNLADEHIDSKYLLKTDIKSFFDSILNVPETTELLAMAGSLYLVIFEAEGK